MRLLAALVVAASLSGCGATPAWLTVTAAVLSYTASVNQLGAEYLKLRDKPVGQCD